MGLPCVIFINTTKPYQGLENSAFSAPIPGIGGSAPALIETREPQTEESFKGLKRPKGRGLVNSEW